MMGMQTMKRYRNDPRWQTARFPGQCAKCKAPIKIGERIFYYPSGKITLSGKCAETAAAEFEAMAADEQGITG
jgi:hypothetical protein